MNAHLGGINMRKTNQKGFTIIELLVVIVIIGILVALALPQLFAAQARGRDTDRKNDLKNISQQLETYYNDNDGAYPVGDIDDAEAALDEAGLLSSDNFPSDPKADRAYVYESADGTSFVLAADLENDRDSSAVTFNSEEGWYVINSVNQ